MAAARRPGAHQLWAMVETPYAMLHAEEIAAASDRLTVLVMGTNDLAKELYAEHVPGRAAAADRPRPGAAGRPGRPARRSSTASTTT